jgi:hypothetical protein
MTALSHVCEGLEGGFIAFDQHKLMLPTIVRLIDVCEKFISFIASYVVTAGSSAYIE